LAVERWNRLHPTETPRVPFVTQALKGAEGPVVVTSDWMKSVNDSPARWVNNRFVALGTDGFGRSDTREALRRHFETDAEHVVVAFCTRSCSTAKVKPEVVARPSRNTSSTRSCWTRARLERARGPPEDRTRAGR